MSRIPPASMRVNAGTLNYACIGTSAYFFSCQLRQNLALDRAFRCLGGVLKWLSSPAKPRFLGVLQPGLLPIYTHLRAVGYYNLQFTQCYTWFSCRSFSGAKNTSSGLGRFKNPRLTYKTTKRPCINAVTSAKVIASGNLNQIKSLCTSNCKTLVSNLKNHNAKRWLHQKSCTKFPRVGASSSNASKKNFRLSQAGIIRRKLNKTVQLCATNSNYHHSGIINLMCGLKPNMNSNFLSLPSLRLINVLNTLVDRSRASIQRIGVNKSGQISDLNFKKVGLLKHTPKLRCSMFTLLCIQKLCGKHVHLKSGEFIITSARRNFKYEKLKKRANEFYDFLFLGQLNNNQEVAFTTYDHYSRLALARIVHDPLLKREEHSEPTVFGPTVSNVVNNVNKNYNPKLALTRQFNQPIGLHVFSFLEGRFAQGVRQTGGSIRVNSQSTQTTISSSSKKRQSWLNNPVFTRDQSRLRKQKLGNCRLKTPVVFQLELHSSSPNFKRLRSTLSIRL